MPDVSSKRRIPWIAIALGIAGFFVVLALDQRLFQALRVDDKAALEEKSVYQALRQFGYTPVWLVVGALVGFHDAWKRRKLVPQVPATGRTLPILIGPASAGLAAEVLKVLLRRERPDEFGAAAFRPWAEDTLSGSGLGMPSSHAAVAFGAAFVLARVFPGAGPLMFLLACGCGLTRVLAGAHLPTDVYVAGVVAYGVVGLEYRLWFGRGER